MTLESTMAMELQQPVAVRSSDLLEAKTNDSQKRTLNELHLFAGAGGGILGGMLLGHKPVCAVEINQYCRKVLLQRQRDGILPRFPIWDDVTTFDGREWNGIADVVCGGFPCQDISAGNVNGKGIEGERSGLWGEMVRIIRDVEPEWVFVENSPMLLVRGLGRVLRDLAALRYDAEWCVLGARDAGAPHQRDRIWIVGHSASKRLSESHKHLRKHATQQEEHPGTWNGQRMDKPGIVGVADGLAAQMDRLRAAGNGQVPVVAAIAFEKLSARLLASNSGVITNSVCSLTPETALKDKPNQ